MIFPNKRRRKIIERVSRLILKMGISHAFILQVLVHSKANAWSILFQYMGNLGYLYISILLLLENPQLKVSFFHPCLFVSRVDLKSCYKFGIKLYLYNLHTSYIAINLNRSVIFQYKPGDNFIYFFVLLLFGKIINPITICPQFGRKIH